PADAAASLQAQSGFGLLVIAVRQHVRDRVDSAGALEKRLPLVAVRRHATQHIIGAGGGRIVVLTGRVLRCCLAIARPQSPCEGQQSGKDGDKLDAFHEATLTQGCRESCKVIATRTGRKLWTLRNQGTGGEVFPRDGRLTRRAASVILIRSYLLEEQSLGNRPLLAHR